MVKVFYKCLLNELSTTNYQGTRNHWHSCIMYTRALRYHFSGKLLFYLPRTFLFLGLPHTTSHIVPAETTVCDMWPNPGHPWFTWGCAHDTTRSSIFLFSIILKLKLRRTPPLGAWSCNVWNLGTVYDHDDPKWIWHLEKTAQGKDNKEYAKEEKKKEEERENIWTSSGPQFQLIPETPLQFPPWVWCKPWTLFRWFSFWLKLIHHASI